MLLIMFFTNLNSVDNKSEQVIFSISIISNMEKRPILNHRRSTVKLDKCLGRECIRRQQ